MRVRFDSEARKELRESVEFYEDRVPGLGMELTHAVEFALRKIIINPLRFRADGLGVRICPVQRFPFTIHFLVEPDILWVVAVAHTKKRPNYWRDRLKKPKTDS